MSEWILEASSVKREFESGENLIEVLKGVDFSLGPGKSASIQGESGSGKSTLLNLLAGLDTPSAGSISWNGVPLDTIPRDKLARLRGSVLGMVFQSYYLVPELRALENVSLGGRISRAAGNLKARSEELLDRVGLKHRMKSMPSTLSGGERQRVAIARAMISEPRVLLADEPTGNLDEGTGDSVMNLLLELCSEKNVALVLVTHNTEYAQRLDDSWSLSQGVLEKLKKNNG